jgi:CHAT domain-containing protein/tetratricopeptide (TPR) repeat protein
MTFRNGRSFSRMSRLRRIVPLFFRLFSLLVVSLLAAAVGSLPRATAGNARLIELAPGSSMLREIAAGDRELFEISLTAGQLLRFSLDKSDLALSLVLYSPTGEKLLEQVSHDYELLEFSFPTDTAGMYRLEISSLERQMSRHYQLSVEPITTAATQDRKVSKAQQSVARASLLRDDWTERSFRQAIERYDEATSIWLSLRDLRNAAVASMKAGRVYFVLGEYRKAFELYEKAAKEAKSAGAGLEESEATSEVGRLYSYLGNNDEARKRLLSTLDFLATDNEANQPRTFKQAYAEALSNLGEVDYSKGDLVKSSQHFNHALKLFSDVGDRRGEGRVHLFKGYIAGGIGEPEEAVAEISQALGLYQAMGDKSGEGLCLTALGLSHSLKRDEEHAIKLHREASAIFRTIGDRQSEGITINALGQAYEFLSDYPMALENYQKALRLFQENGVLDFAAVSLFKVARIHRLLGDLRQALPYYEQCLRLSRVARKSRTQANALNDVALIYASQGNRQKTIGQYRKILKFYATISDRRGQATALNNLGDFLLRLGEKREALDSYKQALPLSEQAGDKDILISTLYNMARAKRDLGALEDALSDIEHSIKIIENLRTNVATPDFRTSYFAGVRKQYDLCIDILMQLDRRRPGQGFSANALLASENARARSLVDLLTESRANIRQGADPQLLAREHELQGLLRSQAQYQMDLLATDPNSSEAEEVKRQMEELTTEYQGIEAQLRDQNPRFLTLAQPSPLSLPQVQAELRDGDNLLLEYVLGDERSYLWAVTSESLRTYELPSRATLEDAGREVYKLLTARQAIGGKTEGGYQANVEASDRLYYEKALKLSQMLLGPVAGQLGNKRLILVTEGILQYVPLDALPAPTEKAIDQNEKTIPEIVSPDLPPLVDTHEIVTLPSIATLAALRREQRRVSSRDKIVAVLADPVFSSNDDRVENKLLPVKGFSGPDQSSYQPALRDFEERLHKDGPMRLLHASEEADAVLGAAPLGTGMIAKGFDASRETAMSSLVGEYKIIHFATHGFVNSEQPELSGIVFTMVNHDGSRKDGFMPLRDIYNLNLSADLVVLSACDTALGKDIKGEGLVGLTRGFMSAGSKSVVASLWKVDDRATAALMSEFYKSMLHEGRPPAAALRFAKQKIRQEKAWSAPYFWAGFVLQGEYKDNVVVDSKSWLRIGWIVSLALALISSALILQRRRSHRAPSFNL